MSGEVVLDRVGYTYQTPAGTVAALHDITLQFAGGTSTAIVGRSGSGKSTLVSILALLRRPTVGTVSVWGTETTLMGDAELSGVRGTSVGVVFQSFHLDPNATAVENVMLPYYFQSRLRRRQAFQTARDRLDIMGIANLERRRPGEMSGGQRQRVAVARALLMSPRLLIADEPTGNLDEETAAAIAETIFSLAPELGSTVVVVTHDSEIARMADRSVRILSGRLHRDYPDSIESGYGLEQGEATR